MNRVLRRPMFKMGGSAGTGITTGLDKPRQQYNEPLPAPVGSTKERLLRAINEQPNNRNLSQFLTTFGLNLLSQPPRGGFFSTAAEAAKKPTAQLFKDIEEDRNLRRQVGLTAEKLDIGQEQALDLQALKNLSKNTNTTAVRNALAMGLVPGTKPFNDYIMASTITTEAAASALQKSGQVVGGAARDKIVNETKFVSRQLGNLNEIQKLLVDDPSLAGLSGSLRRSGNKFITAMKDFNVDLTGVAKKFGIDDLVLDTDIAKLNALEDLLVPAYARVLNPNTRITNLMLQEAKAAINLTGLTGSDEVKARLAEIQSQFETYINDQNKLLGSQEKKLIQDDDGVFRLK